MRIVDPGRILGLALLAAGVVTGCGDEGTDSDNTGGGGGDVSGSGGSSNGSGGKDSGSGGKGSGGEANGLGGEGGEDSGSGGSDTGSGGGDGSGGSDGSGGGGGVTPGGFPVLPSAFSLNDCTNVISGVCSVSQNEGNFVATCAGVDYAGQVAANGNLSFSSSWTATNGSNVAVECTGRTRNNGVQAACKRTTTPTGESPVPVVAECTPKVNTNLLPGLTCLELPKTIEGLTFCADGPSKGGESVVAGDCQIIQDGCTFQASCENGSVFAGTASRTGFTVTQQLTALADAQVANNGSQAFLAGAKVNHSCVLTIEGERVFGSCSAGGASGKPATSVCSIWGAADPVETCDPIAPWDEHLFVLDSCELMKEGEGGVPGIGEPVCAFRQNNCVWGVQCGPASDGVVFGGRVDPSSRLVKWSLTTGTPCEASFDQNGNLTGKCTVPGENACQLRSKTAVPGGADCSVLPADDELSFTTHGCAGGNPLSCHAALQHGCGFMALCDFSGRYPDMIFAGDVSVNDRTSRNRMDFNGIGAYSCYVEEAAEGESGRVDGEWYGQCTTKAGAVWGEWLDNDPAPGGGVYGQCNENTNFNGLRLFFEENPIYPSAP